MLPLWLPLAVLVPVYPQPADVRRPADPFDSIQPHRTLDEILRQRDLMTMERAKQREQSRQQRDLVEKWNTFAAAVNALRDEITSGTVDAKGRAYKRTLKAWADLQRCDAWPYRE